MVKVSEKHDKLFHYTNGIGLKGILETQCLHATHYKFSNDDTEMAAIKPRLKALAEPAFKKLAITRSPVPEHSMGPDQGVDEAERQAELLISKIYAVTFGSAQRPHKFFEPYIVSFCGHTDAYERENGLLSMWRGYGRDQGYAIAFETGHMEQLIKTEVELHQYDHDVFGNIIYSNDDAGFRDQFPSLENEVSNAVSAISRKQPEELGPLYSVFATSASLYKHEGFKEEQEVRLCLSPRSPSMTAHLRTVDPEYASPFLDKTPKEIRFKETLTPYIAIFADIDDRRLPIRKIIVGPHADKERRRERLVKYLELKGLAIEVRCSETPFV